MSDAGLDMMFGLVLENGKRWGECAADFQVADAEAIFSETGPRRHFVTRARGSSKTSDIAGVALAWLAREAPLRARAYVVASNTDQAALLIDAAASFVARTPELEGVLTVENERITAENGAWVRVLSQSDSGAWGLRDAHLLILDEFAQWPETRGAKRVYTAVRTTVQKTPGCRLIILTSAGEPSHWSYGDVFVKARVDSTWRVSETPGPVPWQDPEEIEALRRELRPSEFDRLVMNVWSEDEDRAISPEDYEYAKQPATPVMSLPPGLTGGGWRLHHPWVGRKYLITVDVGTKNDATVMCIAHKEPLDEAAPHGLQRMVVDHLERWQGSRRRPVQLLDIENWLVEASMRYNRAPIYADPDQFVGSVQNLNRRGVKAHEWAFTASSVGQVATALVQTFRNRQIYVPDSKVLRDELLRVRLRESAPGVTRLDHDKAGHDDQAVTLGMAAHLLLGSSWGQGHAFLQMWAKTTRTDEAKEQTEIKRGVRRHLSRRPNRRPQERVRSPFCEHRWRGEFCVFCGDRAQAS